MYRVRGKVASNLWGTVGRKEGDLADEGETDSLEGDI
jgi:hypothetical protein